MPIAGWQLTHGKASLEDCGHLLEDYISRTFLENLKVRECHPEIKIADFYYEDVCNDAMGLAQRMFDFWGVPLAAKSRQQMEVWMAENKQHKFGNFEYTIEEMGVDRARMETRLEPYMHRFYAAASNS